MKLEFAYSLGGNHALPVNDFVAAAGYTPKRGELVKLDANGEVVAATAADTAVLGVTEGGNFLGLAGDAVTVTPNSASRKLALVRTDEDAAYRIFLKDGAADPKVGTAYGVAITAGEATLDTAVTGTGAAIYKVVEYVAAKKMAIIVITSRQIN